MTAGRTYPVDEFTWGNVTWRVECVRYVPYTAYVHVRAQEEHSSWDDLKWVITAQAGNWGFCGFHVSLVRWIPKDVFKRVLMPMTVACHMLSKGTWQIPPPYEVEDELFVERRHRGARRTFTGLDYQVYGEWVKASRILLQMPTWEPVYLLTELEHSVFN